MTTPLYYAQVRGGPTGVSFRLGPSTVFVPVNQEVLYILDPAQLLISGPVEAPMAAFLTETIIEPRLARLSCVTT